MSKEDFEKVLAMLRPHFGGRQACEFWNSPISFFEGTFSGQKSIRRGERVLFEIVTAPVAAKRYESVDGMRRAA